MNNVIAFIEGDEAALEELVRYYTKPLVKYCYSILCNYYDAEDAAQIAFIKVYQKRKSIQNPDSFSAFLYRTAYTACVDIIRKRRLLLLPAAQEERFIAETDTTSYMSEKTEKALKSLRPADRALLYNRIVEEMSYKELSDIYGKSEATLRKRYERAKKKLVLRLQRDVSVNVSDSAKEALK